MQRLTAGLGLAGAVGGSGATPFSLPNAAHLKAFWQPERGGLLGTNLRSNAGSTSPAATISGNLNQTIALHLKFTGGGALGVATYAASNDGGVNVFQTGTVLASVPLSNGITVAFVPGTYVLNDTKIGVGASWTEQVSGAVLLGAATDSAKPTIVWNAQNGLPMWHSAGGTTGYMYDSVSGLANAMASGVNADFSIFNVIKTDQATPAGVQIFFGFSNTGDVDPTWEFQAKNGTNKYRVIKSDDAGNAASPIDSGALDVGVHIAGVINHGSTVDLYLDSLTPVYSGSSSSLVGTATFDTYSILARAPGSFAMAGQIGDQLLYDNAHPTPAAIMNYLKTRWSI